MKLTITARKFKAHNSLKDFIKDELKHFERFSDDITSADIVLSYLNSKDSIKIAEIILHVPGQILTATEQSDDFKKSVSAASEKIIRQLRKLKTKRKAYI